jgi:Rrf2 family protein
MKLTTRGRYGSRLMVDLALHYGAGPVLLKDIASRQEISEKYLGQMIKPLKSAGLISASRGAHGGYFLARPPDEITIAEVLFAVEDDLNLVECVANQSICSRNERCAIHDVWCDLSDEVKNTLNSITLLDLSDRQRQKQTSQPLMYYI